MQAYKIFKKIFSRHGLFDIYFSFIQHKRVVGIDKITNEVFESRLDKNIELIVNKTQNNSYNYSFYKAKLILKGRDKCPRIISMPTIRDRLALKALSILLFLVYENEIKYKLVQSILSDIKQKMMSFDSFIKIDIKNFYPSINHELLFKKIRKKIKKPEILSLIANSICQKSLLSTSEHVPPVTIGIPQGLSISNILANVYMLDLDKIMARKRKYAYFRYVDDILILCNAKDINVIHEQIKKEFIHLNLEINEDKLEKGFLTDSFSYLGYYYTEYGFSVRPSSIDKLRDSIVRNFTTFKYSSDLPLSYLIWNINLRITGCMFEKNKYGWMFFYSQIDDMQLLYQLDHFINMMIKRFLKPSKYFIPKKFVRTYWEITKNLSDTNYIPNFSDYGISQKKTILNEVFQFKDPFSWEDDIVEKVFRKKVFQSIRELEKDFQRLS